MKSNIAFFIKLIVSIVLVLIAVFCIFNVMITGEADDLFYSLIISASLIITSIILVVQKVFKNPEEKKEARTEAVKNSVPLVEIKQTDEDGNPAKQTIVVVQQVQPSEKPKTKGRIVGFVGMALTVAYTIYVIDYFGSTLNDTNTNALVAAVASRIIEPHLYCVLAGSLLSFFGYFAKNKTCMLLAGIAMVGAGTMYIDYFSLVIVQAVLLFITYAQMNETT